MIWATDGVGAMAEQQLIGDDFLLQIDNWLATDKCVILHD